MTSQSLRFARGIFLPSCGASRLFSLSFCAIALSFAADAQVTPPTARKITYLPYVLANDTHVYAVLTAAPPQCQCLPTFSSLLGGGLGSAVATASAAGFTVGQIAILPEAAGMWMGVTTQAQILGIQAGLNALQEAADIIEVVVEVLADII